VNCSDYSVVYGGAEWAPQRTELQKGCDVLIATPGRLLDAMMRTNVGLDRVRYIFLLFLFVIAVISFWMRPIECSIWDLNLTFAKSWNISQKTVLSPIIALTLVPRQTLMFSATFPKSVRNLARDFLADDYVFVKVGRVGSTTDNITQRVFLID
jgi:ATP-dependent RNA helicase DDX3X